MSTNNNIATVHSVGYRNYVLFMLVIVNINNFVDRTSISVLAPAIQAEFQISNTLVGLVMGIAFTAFYATLGFPIARMVDRRSRVNMLAGVLALWSVMATLCGAAMSFIQLFLFRIGVGVGEAGVGPASHSLIGDYFRKIDRPTALGIFSLGVPLGTFLGIYLGGMLVGWIGWRWTFVALGAPGVLLALIVWLTIREPVRGGLDDPAEATVLRAHEDVPFWDVVRGLWASPTFRIMSFSAAPSALCGYGMNMWMPTFITRVHDLAPAAFSLHLGIAIGIGGGLGAMLGGALTARASRRDARAFLTLPALTMVIFAVAMALAVWTTSLFIVYAAIWIAAFCQFFLMGPFFGVVQRLAPLRGRAVATAFFFFILATIGLGIGPLYVGMMNDWFGANVGDAEGLRLALTTLSGISLLAGAIAFFGRNAILKDADKVIGVAAAETP
jgi:MFS family permease